MAFAIRSDFLQCVALIDPMLDVEVAKKALTRLATLAKERAIDLQLSAGSAFNSAPCVKTKMLVSPMCHRQIERIDSWKFSYPPIFLPQIRRNYW